MGESAVCCANVSGQNMFHKGLPQSSNFKCQSSDDKEKISNDKIQVPTGNVKFQNQNGK
jgi:hypothetical protein